MSTIRVNGAERALEAATVAELLAAIGVAAGTRGVAVARNGAVVRAVDWGTTALVPGDAIEIIRARQGG
jgi:sulfur carrier protein